MNARPRPRLGDLVLEKDLVTEEELDEALRVHEESGRPLGEVLTELLGLVSVAEMRDLLLVQRRWRPLGQMLVERRLVTEEQLREALAEHERTGRPLGEIVQVRYRLSSATLDRVLQEQRELELELDRGYTSGLRDALRRRTGTGESTATAPRPAGFGLAERLAMPVSETHTHIAMQQVEAGARKVEALNALLEQQTRELKHLRGALADKQLAVIELEERVAELEAQLASAAESPGLPTP